MQQLILDLNRMSWPAKWLNHFDKAGPMTVEIGFGNGQYLLELYRARKGANIVGLELSLPSMRRAEIRLRKRAISNVRLVHAEAKVALWLLFEPGEIDEVVLNYPDPWPKASHYKRRIIQPAFLNLMANRMKVGGRLRIVTDHAGYADWIELYLTDSEYFESRHPTAYREASGSVVGTKYAKKARAAGQHSFYFEWRRNSAPSASRYPILEEHPMPHAIIRIDLNHHEIAERIDPVEVGGEDLVIRLGKVFKSVDDHVILVDTFLAEKGYQQNVMLSIDQRPDGTFKVYVKSVGYPRPTPAVLRSLKILSKAVMALDPAAELVSHNLGSMEPEHSG